MASALSRLLDHADADADILCAFFAALTTRTAACVSQVSRQWATAAEHCLQSACIGFRWQLPRRPRLQQRGVLANLPWRSLFVSRACRVCLTRPGDFAVRTPDAGAPRCFLCGPCAKHPSTVQRMQRLNLTLDVSGLSGKPLFRPSESKFCSEVSRLSKDSLDNASGERADRLRHASRGRRR